MDYMTSARSITNNPEAFRSNIKTGLAKLGVEGVKAGTKSFNKFGTTNCVDCFIGEATLQQNEILRMHSFLTRTLDSDINTISVFHASGIKYPRCKEILMEEVMIFLAEHGDAVEATSEKQLENATL